MLLARAEKMLFFFFFLILIGVFTTLWWFLPYIDMNQPWVYVRSPS